MPAAVRVMLPVSCKGGHGSSSGKCSVALATVLRWPQCCAGHSVALAMVLGCSCDTKLLNHIGATICSTSARCHLSAQVQVIAAVL
jgi:hypothetical protein